MAKPVRGEAPCWNCGDVHLPGEGCGEESPEAGLTETWDGVIVCGGDRCPFGLRHTTKNLSSKCSKNCPF